MVERAHFCFRPVLSSKLVNGKEYTVQVQSLNGEWSSGYCDPITVKPVVEKKPDAPDNLYLPDAGSLHLQNTEVCPNLRKRSC